MRGRASVDWSSSAAFDWSSTLDRDLARACSALEGGRHGPEQSPSVRRLLSALEQRGLAVYAARGWRLTPLGRRWSADLHRMARRLATREAP